MSDEQQYATAKKATKQDIFLEEFRKHGCNETRSKGIMSEEVHVYLDGHEMAGIIGRQIVKEIRKRQDEQGDKAMPILMLCDSCFERTPINYANTHAIISQDGWDIEIAPTRKGAGNDGILCQSCLQKLLREGLYHPLRIKEDAP